MKPTLPTKNHASDESSYYCSDLPILSNEVVVVLMAYWMISGVILGGYIDSIVSYLALK